MEFTEEKEGEAEQKSYQEFRDFLEKNSGLIPDELRKTFKLYIGFNYGDKGAIIIDDKDIQLITQDAYELFESDGQIGHPKDYKKEGEFTTLLNQTLQKLLKVN